MRFAEKFYRAFFGEPPVKTPKENAPEKGPLGEREPKATFEASAQNIPKRAVRYGSGDTGTRKLEVVADAERKSEDSVLADPELGLFAVADGVGSGGHGDLASRIAVEVLQKEVAKQRGIPERTHHEIMEQAMRATSEALDAKKAGAPLLKGMNTTLTAFLLKEAPHGSMRVTTGHVGDSRAYHYRANKGELLAVTEDDSFGQQLVRMGVLTEAEWRSIDQSGQRGADASVTDEMIRTRLKALVKDKALEPGKRLFIESLAGKLSGVDDTVKYLFGKRHLITQALGGSQGMKPTFQIAEFTANPGDLVFAVSDGISDVLTDGEIRAIIQESLTRKMDAKSLFARLARAAAENVSDRQKSKVLLKDEKTGAPLLFEGDDVSVSGVMIDRPRQVHAQEPRKKPEAILGVLPEEMTIDLGEGEKTYRVEVVDMEAGQVQVRSLGKDGKVKREVLSYDDVHGALIARKAEEAKRLAK